MYTHTHTCFSHTDSKHTCIYTHTHQNIQHVLTGLIKLAVVDSNMYVNCNLKHRYHNHLLYLVYTLHKVYAVTCNYANNLSIIHSSKQSLSLFQDLPCTSYLLDPITTTSLPATVNLRCIQETRTSTRMSMFQHTQISIASITSGSIFKEANGSPLLNLNTVITHCYM
jgi:hypothetical protein